MTAPEQFCTDPAQIYAGVVQAAMRKIFDPARTDECRPLGEGTTDVKFFASATTPLAAWDSFSRDGECTGPFMWVRLVSRYRSTEFPQQSTAPGPCAGTRVIELEVGIGRCVMMRETTDWQVMAEEMEISRDDSFQIENILCLASGELATTHHVSLVSTDNIVPYGPAGGIQGWSGILYVGY